MARLQPCVSSSLSGAELGPGVWRISPEGWSVRCRCLCVLAQDGAASSHAAQRSVAVLLLSHRQEVACLGWYTSLAYHLLSKNLRIDIIYFFNLWYVCRVCAWCCGN